MGEYGACERAAAHAAVVARRRRVQRAALYGAVTLVSVSAAMVLVARYLRAEEADAGAAGPLQATLLGSIFLRNSPATIQSAVGMRAVPVDALQPPPGFVDSRPAPLPGFAMAYRVTAPPAPLMQAAAWRTTPLMQAAAPYMSPYAARAVPGAPLLPVSPPAALGVASSSAQYPMGYFAGAPVWAEKQGAAYVDAPAPRVRAAVPLAPPLPAAAAVPAYGQLAVPAYGQLPAAGLAQPRYAAVQPLGMADSQIGALAGLTGSAAVQYGAAYGAAFASTYNALVGGAPAKKQLALQRLQDKKAGTQTTEAPAPPAPAQSTTNVHVVLPQLGWRMPPLARTGTAVVEQALMTPSEVQEQQQAAADYNGPSLNVMSATGGPTVNLNAEERSAFRVNAQGQLSDSQLDSPGGVGAPAAEGSDGEGGQDSQNPLGAAQGAVAQAAQAVAMPARMTALSELV